MTLNIALADDAVFVGATAEPGDHELEVYIRGELGVRPTHEVIHLRGPIRHTVATWQVSRAQESTSASAWPVGTPLALLPAGDDPTGATTVSLAHALAANARELDLQGCYRRLKIGSEIVWDTSLVSDPRGTPNRERTSYVHAVGGHVKARPRRPTPLERPWWRSARASHDARPRSSPGYLQR